MRCGDVICRRARIVFITDGSIAFSVMLTFCGYMKNYLSIQANNRLV